MSKTNKLVIRERRTQVEELSIKGLSLRVIADSLGVSVNTVKSDIDSINSRYSKMALNNPQMAKKQLERIQKLNAEMDLLRKELWEINEELKAKVKEEKEEYDKAVELNESPFLKGKKLKKPKLYTNARLTTIRNIVGRLDKEIKVLSLFSPTKMVVNNYISIDSLKEVMAVVAGIVRDFVSEDQQKYARGRLEKINIKSLEDDVTDAEIVENE